MEKTYEGGQSLALLLRRPEVTYKDLPQGNSDLSVEVAEQVEIMLKYAGYLKRQDSEVARFKSMEEKQIPPWLDYSKVPNLRTEALQKLLEIQPATIAQAVRISGISPSDVSMILVTMKRGPQPTSKE